MSKFKQAIELSADVKDAYREGLQALKQADRQRVDAKDTRSILGSVNIDDHLSRKYPNAARWDYVVGYKTGSDGAGEESAYWIEIHPATEGEVNSILAKLSWLKIWMKNNAKDLSNVQPKFFWISTGKTRISPTSKRRRQMAATGLILVGSRLRIE